MKKILTTIAVSVIVSVTFFASGVNALADENGHVDLETALPQLLGKYGVEDQEELDCDVLTDEDFEVIGDAWMEERHPGEDHEVMDNMMGGEGSETLKAAHIRMGENYLGCGDYQGMMGNGMMSGGAGMMQGRGMMGAGYADYQDPDKNAVNSINTYLLPITLLSMFAFFTSGTYFFLKKVKNKK